MRSEDAHVDDAGRLVLHTPATRRHIRPAGEEVALGDLLFPAGTVLTPPRAALAAASGVDRVSVALAPTVRVAVLGDEIVGAGVPRPGQVRDVFTHTLPVVLRAFGADPVETLRVPDDRDATTTALAGTTARLVVTTGGTAGSSTDHVRGALDAIGAHLLLDRVQVRPGRPMLLARRADTLYLCLPGNPMAAMVGMVLFGEPAGRRHDSGDRLRARRRSAWRSTCRTTDRVPSCWRTSATTTRTASRGRSRRAGRPRRCSGGWRTRTGCMVVPSGGGAAGDVVPTLSLPWS